MIVLPTHKLRNIVLQWRLNFSPSVFGEENLWEEPDVTLSNLM